ERGAERHLGLPVPDVAGDQPVHRTARFEVALDLLDRAELVRRLLEAESGLELALPGGVRRARVPVRDGALGVEAQQLFGHLPEGGAHRLLHAWPRGAAQAV